MVVSLYTEYQTFIRRWRVEVLHQLTWPPQSEFIQRWFRMSWIAALRKGSQQVFNTSGNPGIVGKLFQITTA